MKQLLLRSVLASMMFAFGGCYVEGPGPGYAGGEEVDDGSGDLVEVSPGVEVVADWNEPVFYANDYYWVNRGGVWYSSTWYRGGWARAGEVPPGVIGVPHASAYVHYRPAGYVAHEPVRGGYESHAQYHAQHAAPSGSVHVRAAVHGGHHH